MEFIKIQIKKILKEQPVEPTENGRNKSLKTKGKISELSKRK